MLIFLCGADTFRSRQHLKKMIAEFKAKRDPQGLNVAVLDCSREEMPAILEQITASPFLAEKKMIVLENLLSSKHKELQSEILSRIKEKKLPESNILVFWEEIDEFKSKEAQTLSEILKKEKYSQIFAPLKGAKLSAWLAAEIKERGGKISNSALGYLIQNSADSWQLNSLINQLIAYKIPPLPPFTKGRAEGDLLEEIEIADINLFLSEKIDDNIFNLADALVAKRPKQVYQMIQEQYRLGKDPGYLFIMILRQFRILLQLRDLFEREDNANSDSLAKKLGLPPFVVKKSLALVKKYTSKELKNIYQQLLEIDIKTKTGLAGQSLLLDVFVGKFAN